MPEPNMPGDTNRLQTLVGKTLLRRIGKDDSALFSIVITSKKADAATRAAVLKRAADLISEVGDRTGQLLEAQTDAESSNIHAQLQGKVIRALVERDLASETPLIEAIGLDLYDGKIFNPDHLVRSVIAIPLLRAIETSDDRLHAVVIEVNISYSGGRPNAKKRVVELITDSLNAQSLDGEGVIEWKTATSEQYVYARLAGPTIRKMVAGDMSAPSPNGRAVYRIWPDFRVRAQVWKSVPAIKGDACRRAFASTGEGIVWAVLDSGIDGKHPHFEKHKNLELPAGLKHMDFVGKELHEVPANELTDPYGHGTHVAGIIAGEVDEAAHPKALVRERDAEGVISYKSEPICCGVYGVAPSCKLVSY